MKEEKIRFSQLAHIFHVSFVTLPGTAVISAHRYTASVLPPFLHRYFMEKIYEKQAENGGIT